MNNALKFNQLDQLNLLPEINKNKGKSLPNSPKNQPMPIQTFNLSPQPSYQVPNSLRQEGLVITHINDKPKKDRRATIKLTKRIQDTSLITKKYNQLSKLLIDKEEIILHLESKLSEYKKNCEDMQTKSIEDPVKVELEVKPVQLNHIREEIDQTKIKDFEIFNLKNENEQIKKILENVTIEKFNQEAKLKNFEKICKNNEDSAKKLENQEIRISVLEKMLNDKGLEIAFKAEEIKDLGRMLKLSEDKRKAAVDQQKDFESKYIVIKTKYIASTTTISEQKSTIDQLANKLLGAEGQLKDLKFAFSEQNSELSECKSELYSLNSELEMLRAVKKSSTDSLELKIQKIEEENKGLKNSLQTSNAKPIRSNSKRSETVINSKFFTRLANQELVRTHHKLFELEEKLINKNLELEKIRTDYNYVSKKLDTKEVVVNKLKQMLEDESESTERNIWMPEVCLNVDSDEMLQTCVGRVERMRSEIKCSNCSGSEMFCVNYPCGHLTCAQCREKEIEVCGSCGQNIDAVVASGYFKQFLEFLEVQKTELEQISEVLIGRIKVNS